MIVCIKITTIKETGWVIDFVETDRIMLVTDKIKNTQKVVY
jgi:hypothetical protein